MSRLLPFKQSQHVSIGTEIELQLINPHSFALMSRAKEIIRHLKSSEYQPLIKPEITQSMIEINSSVHSRVDQLYDELSMLKKYLLTAADEMKFAICGGGTHPFHQWTLQKIFPSVRYRDLSHKYRYLSKRSTVFGQHVHVGCKTADDALYLTHALARYVPHLLAISASSPFYLGINTGYQSSRCTVFNSFPSSGVIPVFETWEAFSEYYYLLKSYELIHSMKDIYWDIRPKPEFGTVEIRICDTPLTINKAALITAYIQSLAYYLLEERPVKMTRELYYVYQFNRFQGSRYGFDGILVDTQADQKMLIADDLMHTIKILEPVANHLHCTPYLTQIVENVRQRQNDAIWLRQIEKEKQSLPKLVEAQCELWRESD